MIGFIWYISIFMLNFLALLSPLYRSIPSPCHLFRGKIKEIMHRFALPIQPLYVRFNGVLL
ncbi:MAG: hypothetical protein EB053_05250 [Chlamydiae bacterium]|nr:hypothetical protein [Chlamydiota bacterium]